MTMLAGSWPRSSPDTTTVYRAFVMSGGRMFTITGPVTINVNGPTADDIRIVVASEIAAALTPLEQKMSDFTAFAANISTQLDTFAAGLTDIAADVAVLLTKAAQAGVFTPEEQALADAVQGKFDAVHTGLSNLNDEVGDQDGSDNPPAEPTA
jgi:hypothetical protein